MAAILANVKEGLEAEKQKTLAFGHFKKTKMCCYFQSGHCVYGSACNFAHHHKELQKQVDLAKTSLCKAFIQGCCPNKSRNCAFAHGKRELRSVLPEVQEQQEALVTQETVQDQKARKKAQRKATKPIEEASTSASSELDASDEDATVSESAQIVYDTHETTGPEAPAGGLGIAMNAHPLSCRVPNFMEEVSQEVSMEFEQEMPKANRAQPLRLSYWNGRVYLGNVGDILQRFEMYPGIIQEISL